MNTTLFGTLVIAAAAVLAVGGSGAPHAQENVAIDSDDIGGVVTSAKGPEAGVLDETGDATKAHGWTVLVLDTNGNGRRDEYVEPDGPWVPSGDRAPWHYETGKGTRPLVTHIQVWPNPVAT